MPLTPGSKLGPYEIQSQLGAGGMGEVYRALDTRLSRNVAIKVLAARLSNSPELKQRMEREARAISCLSHPNICQLHDIGSQDGTDYLIMEFLEGETLAQRLSKGPILLPEVFKIGIALADALAAAHRQGIVHRDLKPGNIMLTQTGAKLMDFGLAKPLGLTASGSSATAVPPSFTAAATLSGPSPLSPLTTAGTIIGTVQYMSPEQIEGKEADVRSDIFAFGAVLYEMVAGKRPFEGKSQLSLATSILEKDPDHLSSVKPEIPPAFEHVINTCLQKNPEDRYLAAHDIKLDLQWIASEKLNPVASTAEPAGVSRSHLRAIAAFILALVVGAAAGLLFRRPASQALSTRTVINPPEKTTLNLSGDSAGPPVLSPDGAVLAFTATGTDSKTTIWVRPVNSLEPRQLPGTENAIFPFWSFDSRLLGFFADSKLKTVELEGGSTQILADAPFGRGGAWFPDGTIIYAPTVQSPLMRINVNGGAPAPATQVDRLQHTSHRWPMSLPDGKHFLYLAIHHDPSKGMNNTLYYASLDGKENLPLLRSKSNAIYAAGYLLFARNDQMLAQPFNAANGKLTGEPQTVARGIMNDITTWHMDASASEQGLLVFGTGGLGDWQLVFVDRTSKQIVPVADKLNNLMLARLSPQGDRIALQIDTGTADVWVLDLARGVKTRLTFGPVQNVGPVWSPDGKWIAYSADRNGRSNICRKPADGAGAEELLVSEDQILLPNSWSRDGKYLIYQRGPLGNTDVWALPLEGDRKPRQILPNVPNAGTSMAEISPDGRWLAYMSSESGGLQVYVVAFDGGQGKWQISTNGGTQPHWSSDGKELFYLDPGYNIISVPVKEVGGALQFGAAQSIVNNWSAPQVFFDLTPDGKKILLDRISQQVSQSVTVVSNFTASLKN
jgi:serine/threonine protein kinase